MAIIRVFILFAFVAIIFSSCRSSELCDGLASVEKISKNK